MIDVSAASTDADLRLGAGRHRRGARGRGVAPSPERVAPPPELEARVVEGPDAGRWVGLSAEGAVSLGGGPRDDLPLGDLGAGAVTLQMVPDGVAVRATSGIVRIGEVGLRDGRVPVGARLSIGASVVVVQRTRQAGDLKTRLARHGLIYADPVMDGVATAIAEVAPFTMSVLVQGETGTGKEIVARAIHGLSLRSGGPFEIVDCGAIPRNLVESELFGHERGAFTGASNARRGAFERAHGGTLFLDEIGELPPEVQPVLLGVLQRKRLRRVGGEREIPVDVRVIAATHRDVSREIEEGRFRSDLFYRLATVRLEVPPLRERPADVHAIASALFLELTGQPGRGPLDETTWARLAERPWPGNVRELRAALERALATGRIELDAVNPARAAKAPRPGPRSASDAATPDEDAPVARYRDARAAAVDHFERTYLEGLMRRCKGNASQAARLASMDRPYLLRLLRRHNLR